MRLPLLFATVVASASFLLTNACQRNVSVKNHTDVPATGTVTPTTPTAPTTTTVTSAPPDRPMAAFDKANRPKWLDDKILAFQAEPKQNPPIQVMSYRYNGEVVYYVTAPCCDQFTTLYDQQGKVLCQPDGGITGRGDGRCADFTKNRTEEKLVWQDQR
ncbi:hypothetical protein LJY25_04605 [Hymenobacter sp. BT175]|uniref:DUF6970 domain-containing protein n=1 Tax=Hymenobacter translucens TaxID=2886507 RepID=UPI001D0F3EC5|nr:hypothetical protein [Hymenobacter translucens]MCC2545716.1 hypothetical protein [Hymenobacter translucens]